ncbi:N-methylhydantoinase B [Natronospira proteinivora]|uniref:N-methylhydantoinase B n=1 Tax=Natronospira proteinivora TaxID=1807133 RepID=A0ABT1G4M4_9GAMM|nr:hydantoinase B/oxoprolinase family protein [Natronospira proteinivora]MCP1726240.1 N-methylhydantoinase B [Natronospira proteinivora]
MDPFTVDPVKLSVFANRIDAICEQMGAVLRRAAFSPNIRDRLDFSCALFDARGELCAQAAHIPVHLGSMAHAMADVVDARGWQPGDILALNDPYLGGTHLPDVTVIMPVFLDGELLGFVANRAHHSDIGADSPGSLPLSRRLEEEGVVIPPTLIGRDDELDETVMDALTQRMNTPSLVAGDFAAQVAAARSGREQVLSLARDSGLSNWRANLAAVNDYAARLADSALARLPEGSVSFTDWMDDDGFGHRDLPIQVRITVDKGAVRVDFSGTAAQVEGNINCPLSVTAAAVLYVFRCLMPEETPASAGAFRAIQIHAEPGSLLNARAPAAVAAGNVETSSRVVDVVMGALAKAVPEQMAAASQGTMNNLAMGATSGRRWDYYETLGGGMGAHCHGPGLDGVHSHMTNTLNTPVEVVEMNWPLRVLAYGYRQGSGGHGHHDGGVGLERCYQFLAPAEVSVISERRRHAPWGLAEGGDGSRGRNFLNEQELPSKACFRVQAGDRLLIQTPGGGAWGPPARP